MRADGLARSACRDRPCAGSRCRCSRWPRRSRLSSHAASIQRRDRPPSCGFFGHHVAALGGEDPVPPVRLDRRPDDALGRALGVDVGGVDEVDAGLVRGRDDARRRRGVGAVAEHHGAEAERRNHEAAVAKWDVVHAAIIIAAPRFRSSPAGPHSHERAVRGRRPAQGRYRARRSGRVAAGRGGVRQAHEDQGRQRALALRRARRRRRAERRRQARRRPRSRASCGRRASEGEFGFADLAREYYGGHADARAGGGGGDAAACVADAFLQEGQGPLPQGAARTRSRPRSPRSSARRAKASRSPRGSRSSCAHELPERAARQAADAPVQARQERARMEGAGGGVRSAQDQSGGSSWRRAARSPRRTTTTSIAFLAEAFPQGTAFPAVGRRCPRCPSCRTAAARAFSIDDATTTEIDDAFSVRELANGNYEVGIHIACPALAIPRDSALDRIARTRLSTVYMPGRKLTMLPDEAVAAFTLRAGAAPPALSLSIEIDARRRAGARTRRASSACRSPPTCASTPSAMRSRTHLPSPARPAVDARAARAVEARAASRRAARQERHQPHRLQLRRRLGRRPGRPRRHRAARARQPARQARRRAHDPRQQHVGTAARRPRRGRACIACRPRARSR